MKRGKSKYTLGNAHIENFRFKDLFLVFCVYGSIDMY